MQIPGFLGKTTVEILDDASPDATPRNDDDNDIQEVIEAEKQRIRRFERIEESYRNLLFEAEAKRISSTADTFVGTQRTQVEDIRKEWARLSEIETSARSKQKSLQKDAQKVSVYLAQDRAALQVQRLFRGHLGRRRVHMLRQLSAVVGRAEDWIEVRDAETGDVWFYNTITNQSQWQPPSIPQKKTGKKKKTKLPELSKDATKSKEKEGVNNNGMKTLTVSMSLPSLRTNNNNNNNTANSTSAKLPSKKKHKAVSDEVRRAVDRELGIDKLLDNTALTQPDGTFHRPQLRTVVLDALLDTRFDNVSSVLADTRWFDRNEELQAQQQLKMAENQAFISSTSGKVDPTRTPMVSVFQLKPRKQQGLQHSQSSRGGGLAVQSEVQPEVKGPQDLVVAQIPHAGLETAPQQMDTMCFGCWSAGITGKCSLHETGEKLNASKTMLLCRNWDLDVLRRRHRSEEIQEVFMRREASLRYDTRRKAFFTVSEQRHPIYRMSAQLLERLNARNTLRNRIRYWLQSLGEQFRLGQVLSGDADIDGETAEAASVLRIKRGILHLSRAQRFSKTVYHQLPRAPITGSSLAELRGEIRFLFRRFDGALSQDVDVITVLPLPAPQQLYQPRHYHLTLPVTFPLLALKPSESDNDPNTLYSMEVLPANSFIADEAPAGWLERLCSLSALQSMHGALQQVLSLTPVTPTDLQSRSKRPTPTTSKFAVLSDKPCADNNLCVGGLARELLVFQIVSTYYPPQYGNFLVTDKASVSPGVSPEVSIAFQSLVMPPTLEEYVERALEHPLSHRRAPTIALHSAATANQKHLYGRNRPEQTGEQEAHGFRTTAWAPRLGIYAEIDATSFTPGQAVSSLNTPRANKSVVTAADTSYPFCEPSTRDNSTLDFYHLLLAGVVSLSKPQIFTALTVQEPGDFQKHYRLDRPMGHLLVAVYRSWAFTQRDTLQRFLTDDGVPYWYHRKTGQTFWERPRYEEEEASPLLGGTLLDLTHAEAPSVVSKALDPAVQPRYNQGELREEMLRHLETKKEALQRRRAASTTVRNARERGLLGAHYEDDPEGVFDQGDSVENQAAQSTIQGSRVDFLDLQHPHNALHSLHATEGLLGASSQVLPAEDSFISHGSHANHSHSHPHGVRIDHMVNSSAHVHESGSQDFMGMYQQDTQTSHNLTHSQYNNSSHPNNLMMMQQSTQSHNIHTLPPHSSHQPTMMMPHQQMSTQMSHQFPMQQQFGMDPNAFAQLSQSLGALFSQIVLGALTQPAAASSSMGAEQWLSMGATMGNALLQTNVPNQMAQSAIQQHLPAHPMQHNMSHFDSYQQGGGEGGVAAGFPALSEEQSVSLSVASSGHSGDPHTQHNHHHAHAPQQQQQMPSRVSSSFLQHERGAVEPIGLAHPTAIFSSDKTLDHGEEAFVRESSLQRFDQPLNTLEKARRLQVLEGASITDTPDVRPPKLLTIAQPSNAEAGLIEEALLPVLAYPELSSGGQGKGAPPTFKRKVPAGEGTAYVNSADASRQLHVQDSALRKHAMPLPVGFFAAIESKHVATQAADYLPQVPNLPQSRTIGRVKPRSAAADWLMISFDPWSAGRNPLSTEFVPSLMEKADKLLTAAGAKASETMDSMRENTIQGAFVDVRDEPGLAKQRQDVTKAQILADDYKRLCSLCRHNKFSDAEQLISQPDWAVPIDYQDDQGNALVHVAAQNGSKRLVKLCLRKGADLNLQNLNGQTALHFAYGYGYSDVGDYLVGKGADDSLRNKDGLTCYEGLGARELTLL